MKILHIVFGFRFILVALISFTLIGISESSDGDEYSVPAYKMREKMQTELWRNPILFDNVGNNIYFVKPGDKGFAGATTFWKYNLDTKAETQILADTTGRFAYPVLSPDGKKLLCQFQKGDLPEKNADFSTFNQHSIIYCDLTKEPLKFVEIKDETPESYKQNEMMPEISSDGTKIYYGSGKFFNVSDVDDFCHIRELEFGKKEGTIYTKSIELKKCYEFSPLIMRSNEALVSLSNIDPASPNVGIFIRKTLESRKFRKIKKLYEPAGVGVFSDHPDVKLDASWLSSSRFTPNLVCQVGGWNLYSIVKLYVGLEDTTVLEILKGTKTASYMHPSISTNGKWLAYEKCDIEMLEPPVLSAKITKRAIYIMNLETLETKKISDNGMIPVVSPDMTQIVYLEKTENSWQLKIADTGIKADEQGILSRDELNKIEDLVNKLGDGNYQTRENAKVAIMRFGKTALYKLKQLEKSANNSEIKYRLKEIIEYLESEIPVLPAK